MQLETCWRLEDGGMQNLAPTSRCSNVTKLRSSDICPVFIIQRRNVTGVVHRILGYKSRNHLFLRGEEVVRMRTGEKAKA